ncbi:hypothetical protein FQZ97_964150 [compost metagenome]
MQQANRRLVPCANAPLITSYLERCKIGRHGQDSSPPWNDTGMIDLEKPAQIVSKYSYQRVTIGINSSVEFSNLSLTEALLINTNGLLDHKMKELQNLLVREANTAPGLNPCRQCPEPLLIV